MRSGKLNQPEIRFVAFEVKFPVQVIEYACSKIATESQRLSRIPVRMDVGQIKSVFRDDVVVDILGKVTFQRWLVGGVAGQHRKSPGLS